MSCHLISCYVISCHINSDNVISNQVISHQTIFIYIYIYIYYIYIYTIIYDNTQYRYLFKPTAGPHKLQPKHPRALRVLALWPSDRFRGFFGPLSNVEACGPIESMGISTGPRCCGSKNWLLNLIVVDWCVVIFVVRCCEHDEL